MKNLVGFLFILFAFNTSAQYDHESVFSDLEGEMLRVAVVESYKPAEVLDYGNARDTFFRNIDAVDHVLECVYTGFKITLDPNSDPTIDAFAKGINTEHTFPRSKGAWENTDAHSDMHHLFPTLADVNTARGSLPFADIIDSQTDRWFIEDNVETSIPSQGIDNYSELHNSENFEPRERHKGDVARAYFYFYTMYQSQADQADPDFFEIQRETLCKWHFDDPVDEKEWIRNIKIAEYQDGKKNPFILDCKLARLYCDEIMGSCLSVSTEDRANIPISIRPNPAQEGIFLESYATEFDRYKIYSLDGQKLEEGWLTNEVEDHFISINHLQKGFYFLYLYDKSGQQSAVSRFVKN